MSHNIDVLHAFTKAYNDEMFCSNIKNDGDVDKTILALCSCNCCPRHMTCRPEYDKIKILIDNTDAAKTADIIHMIESETLFLNNTSDKFIFVKSFMDMGTMIVEMDDIKEEDIVKLQQVVALVLKNFTGMMKTFNETNEIKLICNIFKLKLTTILSCDTKDNENKSTIPEELKEVFDWAMDVYEASKEVSKELTTTGCGCGCRSFIRSMLMVYMRDIGTLEKRSEKSAKKN